MRKKYAKNVPYNAMYLRYSALAESTLGTFVLIGTTLALCVQLLDLDDVMSKKMLE